MGGGGAFRAILGDPRGVIAALAPGILFKKDQNEIIQIPN